MKNLDKAIKALAEAQKIIKLAREADAVYGWAIINEVEPHIKKANAALAKVTKGTKAVELASARLVRRVSNKKND